mgnify:CR=1 FL=1
MDIGSSILVLVVDCGTIDDVIQISNSYCFHPSESPTNITALNFVHYLRPQLNKISKPNKVSEARDSTKIGSGRSLGDDDADESQSPVK